MFEIVIFMELPGSSVGTSDTFDQLCQHPVNGEDMICLKKRCIHSCR